MGKRLNPIPKPVREQVSERDKETCQRCYAQGCHIHHIVHGGTGRRRIHEIYNLITLCLECHTKAHTEPQTRKWTYEWSRERYGGLIDELERKKWSADK